MTIKTKKTICTTIAFFLFLLTLGIVGGCEWGDIPIGKGFALSALCEIKNTDKPMLLPAEVAPVLGCDAHNIRIQARQAPDLLGFPVVVIGNRTLIPRRPFLAYIGEEAEA